MKHKYHAKPCTHDGERFDSKAELKRWNELKILDDAGVISHLSRKRTETTFVLHGVNGSIICKYIGDFVYKENGVKVCEDKKGMKTPAYRIKRKMFQDEYRQWEHRES